MPCDAPRRSGDALRHPCDARATLVRRPCDPRASDPRDFSERKSMRKIYRPSSTPLERARLVRSGVLLLLALAQPIAGRFGHRSGASRSIEARSDAVRGPITPPKGAFAIWAPIFVGNLALALDASFGREPFGAADRRIAWFNSAAFAANTAWSLQAQAAGLGWPSLAIITGGTVAASAAMIEAERVRAKSGFARVAAYTSGPLAGWLTVASFANLDGTLTTVHGRPTRDEAERRTMGLIGAATGAAAVLATASRGNAGYAAAAAWGLGSIALRNARERRPRLAVASAIGVGTVLLATMAARAAWRR